MWIEPIKSSVGSSERVARICCSVWSCVPDSMFGPWRNPTSPGEARPSSACAGGHAQNLGRAFGIAIPSSLDSLVTTTASLSLFGVPTHHPPTCDAEGYAKNLVGASILTIPSSFDSPVTTIASLSLESTASAKAKSFTIPSSLDSPVTGTANLDLFGVHTNQPPTRNGGGPAEISEGASTLAIHPSFDSTAASRTSPDPDSNASASAKLLQSAATALSTGFDSAARSTASVSADLSSSSPPVWVEPHKKLIDLATTLCMLWSPPSW